MSLKPIDLQTLFNSLNQLGREQSYLREASAQQQARNAGKEIERHDQIDHSVNQTVDTEAEENKIMNKKDEHKQGSQDQKQHPENTQGWDSDEKEPDNNKNFFSDPDLGHKVNITG